MPTMDQLQPYTPIIIMAINGVIAGWLAGLLFGGGGLIRNMLVGIIGAFVGGALVRYNLLQLPTARHECDRSNSLRDTNRHFDHRRCNRHSRRSIPRRPVRGSSRCMQSIRMLRPSG